MTKKELENILMIYSTKGGVGKSTIANVLHRSLGLNYVTNQRNTVLNKTEFGKFEQKPTPQSNTLFDFAGELALGSKDIAKACDLLIIPLNTDDNSCLLAHQTLEEVGNYAKKKIFVLYYDDIRTKLSQEIYDNAVEFLESAFPNIPYIPIKKSAMLQMAMYQGWSVEDVYNETALTRTQHKASYDEYNTLYEVVKGVLNG